MVSTRHGTYSQRPDEEVRAIVADRVQRAAARRVARRGIMGRPRKDDRDPSEIMRERGPILRTPQACDRCHVLARVCDKTEDACNACVNSGVQCNVTHQITKITRTRAGPSPLNQLQMPSATKEMLSQMKDMAKMVQSLVADCMEMRKQIKDLRRENELLRADVERYKVVAPAATSMFNNQRASLSPDHSAPNPLGNSPLGANPYRASPPQQFPENETFAGPMTLPDWAQPQPTDPRLFSDQYGEDVFMGSSDEGADNAFIGPPTAPAQGSTNQENKVSLGLGFGASTGVPNSFDAQFVNHVYGDSEGGQPTDFGVPSQPSGNNINDNEPFDEMIWD